MINEPNEITEKIIHHVANSTGDQNVNIVAEQLGISLKEILSHLKFLELYDIAKFHHTPQKNIIQKTENFNNVVNAGGLGKYLQNIEDFKRKQEIAENEYIIKERKYQMLIDKQIQDLENRLSVFEGDRVSEAKDGKTNKALAIIANIIAFVSLIVAILVAILS